MQEDTRSLSVRVFVCVCCMWWMTMQCRGVLGLIVMSAHVCGNPSGERWQTGVCVSIYVCASLPLVYVRRPQRKLWYDVAGGFCSPSQASSRLSGDEFEEFVEAAGWSGSRRVRQVLDCLNNCLFAVVLLCLLVAGKTRHSPDISAYFSVSNLFTKNTSNVHHFFNNSACTFRFLSSDLIDGQAKASALNTFYHY